MRLFNRLIKKSCKLARTDFFSVCKIRATFLQLSTETFQGVPLDSLGVGAWEIRRIIAPDHRQRRQEAPKRILAMPAAFFHFSIGSLQRGGVLGRRYSFHVVRCGWGP
jgi:hypothetical protein